ncbi:trypsin-like serine peptidase [Staphylococcus equorum]|uniref:trypsin-like serine peptidase n=1 Tax=Staphylococcus equorum TaxID=246432 RepID=UPI00298294B8|nr:trypsin-like peptidase domain-containing protein [Staphylococcus equorum]MDW5471251.1 trypsin-like serine protease [Staphylococcus equorum]
MKKLANFTIKFIIILILILPLQNHLVTDNQVGASLQPTISTTYNITEPTNSIYLPTPVNYEIPQENLQSIEDSQGESFDRILGKDSRSIVKNYTKAPYKTVVLLNMSFNNNVYIGSGVMISPDTVLTAAHNIYDSDLGGWANNVTVYAGANSHKATIGKSKADKKYVLPEWIKSKSKKHDLAIIKLNSQLGFKTGTLGITDQMQINEQLETAGYPADKGGTTQYKVTGLLKRLTETNIFYDMDTYGGQSGSAVWNKNKKIVGVHAYGATPLNFGTKITNDNLKLIINWGSTPVGYKYDKDVTISKEKIVVWSDFLFSKKISLKNIKLGNVYKAKYFFKHNNGHTYLSLYDNKNKWIGYFNKRDVTDLTPTHFNKKVKVSEKNFPIWNNLYFDNQNNISTHYYNQTFTAKYIYTLGNKKQYYSIYDSKNRWIGYIDVNATKQ